MKLNFANPLTDLSGKPVLEPALPGQEPTTAVLCKILSISLMTAQGSKHPQKFIHWAEALNKCGEINIDREDAKILREHIKNMNNTALVLARLLDVMDNEREE